MSLDQLLDEIADEVFPVEAEQPNRQEVARSEGQAPAPTSILAEVADEVFGGKPPEEQPGFLSRAASAVTSAVADAPVVGPIAQRLGFKATGPAVSSAAAAPPPSGLPQVKPPEAFKATRSSAAIQEPSAAPVPPPPVPVKIGPVPGLAPVVEEARRAPLLERVAGISPSRQVPPVAESSAPSGMLGRAAAAAGIVSPEAAKRRGAEADLATTSVMRKPEGMSEERWQFRQALNTLNRTTAVLPRAFTDRVTFGIVPAILDTFGLETPKARAPQGQAESLAAGAGELAGFIAGPAKAAHALMAGNVTKWLAPRAGDAVGVIMARNIATQAATLGVASGLAHLGEEAQADSLGEAYRQMGEHVKGGAMLGAAFGAFQGAIPSNALLPRAARLGVGLTVLDAMQGTQPLDDRALSQKAFDYGLNIFFLWKGQDPRKVKALLAKVAAERTEEVRATAKDPDTVKPVIPEQVLKSALDKAQQRAAALSASESKLDQAQRSAAREARLAQFFLEEVGDVATGTTATELRSARQVAEQKTGGAIPQREVDYELRVAPPQRHELILPGGQPGPAVGPVMILGPTGRPAEAMPPPIVMEPPRPTTTALDVATARGGTRPAAPPPRAPQAPAAATLRPEHRAPAAAARPKTFKAFVEASGRRWPLTARDPGFAALRRDFDSFSKGIYEPRRGPAGWAVTNRFTGEAVDHLQTGAKAQLEANRLNATVTLDSWRQAQVPAPVRMVLSPKPSEDLSAKPAPAPKIEAGTPAAAEQARQREILKPGPPPTAEPPAEAKVATPPAAPPVAIGREQEIRVPAGNRYKTQYQIVEAKDLVPSHNAQTFAKDPRYPEGVQNRPYHSDKSEQAKVIRQGQDFEPLFLVSPQPSSGGTPIVAPDSNVVLSGNSRSMSLLRTLGTPAFDRYKTALKEMAPALGLKPEDVDRTQQPVLVRRLVETDTTPEFYRRFAAETNQGFKQSLNTEAAAVSQGQAIKPETMAWIAGQVDVLGENASLREFLRSGKDREIVRRLLQDGVFTDRELNRVVDSKTGLLNEDGKRLVERAVLGNVVRDSDLLAQTPDSVLAKIERSLGAIAKIRGRGEAWDLSADLTQALRTTAEVKAVEAGSVAALRSQGSLLGAVQPAPRADALADALLRMKPTEFRAAMDRYADEAQRDVRGQGAMEFAAPKTPAEAFRVAFGVEVPEPSYVVGEAESGSPSGPRPNDARRSGVAGVPSMKSETQAPPLTQERPSQVSTAAPPSAVRTSLETAPSFTTISSGESIASTSRPSLTQPTADVQSLRLLADRSIPELRRGLKAAVDPIAGARVVKVRVKPEASVLDKIGRKTDRSPDTFTDFLGGRVEVDTKDALDRTVAAIGEQYPNVRIDDFLDQPNPWGYRAVHIDVKLPNGMLAEVQVVPTPVREYQDSPEGHPIYRHWRARATDNLNPAESARFLSDRGTSRRGYQAAYDRWAGTAPRQVAPAAESVAPRLAERPEAPPAVRPAAPAEFHSLQERPGGRPPLEVFTLNRDIPGHDRGSTLSRETLEAAGFIVPAPPADARVGEVYRPEAKTSRLEDFFAIRGGSGESEGREPQAAATKPLPADIRAELVEFGREQLRASTARSFPDFARRVTERLGPKVRPYLPELWSEVLRESARTQTPIGRPAVESPAPPTPEKGRDREGARRAKPKEPEKPTPIPEKAPPIEPAPGLTEPKLKLGLQQQVLDAAEELFRAGKVERDPTQLISDQILGMLRDGRLHVPEMSQVLAKHGMNFTEFGEHLFRPAVRDAAKRLGALGILARKIKDADLPVDVLDKIREREPELDEAIRSMSWWKRANNVRRGLLVTQLATAIRNFESQVGRVGIDVLDQGLQGALQRRFGKTQTRSATDAMGTLLDVFGQLRQSGHREMREKVDAILEAFPREGDRLFQRYMSDVNTAAKRDGATGKVDAAFDKADRAVDVLNTVNKFQEYVVRRAVFAGRLDQVLRAKGKDLDTIIRENRVGEIDKADIADAVQKSLEITYSESPAYGSTGYHIMKAINGSPLSLPFPFPRFMMNSIKFLYEFSPLGPLAFLNKAERQRLANGDTRLISRATIGTGMFLAAYAMQELWGGERWYEVRPPWMDRAIDIRPFNPFAAYFFVAYIAKRTKDGTLYKLKMADIAKGVLSVNVRAGLGSYTLDKMVEGLAGLSTPEDLQKFVAGGAGRLVGGLLMPLQTWTDFYAQISGDEAQKIRSTDEEPFLGEIKKKIPVWGETLPEVYSPTHAEPVKREAPGVRQLTGLTLTSPKNAVEKELDRLQFDRHEIMGFTGSRTADNLVAGIMGPLVEELEPRLASAAYVKATNAEKALMLKRWLHVARLRAKAMARREDPDLFRELAEKRRPAREQAALEEAGAEGRWPAGVRRR